MAAKKSAAAEKAAPPKSKPAKSAAKKAAPKNPFAGESKLAKFLVSKKIDPRRVLSASHVLETLQREDRDIRLARRRAKAGGGEGEGDKKEAPKQKSR